MTQGGNGTGGWLLKTLFGAFLVLIVSLGGYIHNSTVANLTSYIDAVEKQTTGTLKAMDDRLRVVENQLVLANTEQNKRTARLDVLERDVINIERNFGSSLARIEKQLDSMAQNLDALRFAKNGTNK